MTRLFLSFALAAALTAVFGSVLSSASARPGWSAPIECVLDEGYNRYRPCSAGGE